MSKMRSRPPAQPSVDDFISGAGTQTVEAPSPSSVPSATPEQSAKEQPRSRKPPARRKEHYPWEDAHVRKDVTKVYNLRLPEPYLLKLKHIAEHTPDSMQKFCLDVLKSAINRKIKEMEKKDR
jgi:hypothetical protein